MKKYKGSFLKRSIGKCVFRNKNDIITTVLNYIKYINVMSLEYDKNKEIQIVLCIDKMSRLFISNDKSIHSFRFPFFIDDINGRFKVHNKDLEIDNEATSLLLSFFGEFEGMESIYDLLVFDPGYVRYDIDFSDRLDPLNHPAHHLDINYDNASTYKLGLSKEIDFDEFINILNINKKCYFLK